MPVFPGAGDASVRLAYKDAGGVVQNVDTGNRLPVDIGSATVNLNGDVVAEFDGIEEALGAPADAAAAGDAATSGLIGLVKRLLGKLPSGFQQGSGAITATTTRVTLASDGPGVVALDSINTKTPALQGGAVPVSDNSSSLTVDGKAYRAAADITRPANTTAYTAGDVIGTGTGDDAIITLANVGPSAGFVIVQSIELVIGISAVPSGMTSFRLHFYNAKPAAAADNSVFDLGSADRNKYIGYIDLAAPVDLGSTCFTQVDFPGKLFKLDTGSTSLFCELQTIGGFTPAANSEVYSLRVKTLEAGL